MGDGQPWWLAPLAVRVAIMVTVLRWLTTLYRITPEQVQLRLGRLEREAISTYSGSGPECSCDRLSAGSAVRLGEGGYRHLETRAGQWLAERSINAADCGRSTGAVACHHLNHPSAPIDLRCWWCGHRKSARSTSAAAGTLWPAKDSGCCL
jgi:hypothetical protein